MESGLKWLSCEYIPTHSQKKKKEQKMERGFLPMYFSIVFSLSYIILYFNLCTLL